MSVLLAEGLVAMLVAMMFMSRLFLGHRGTRSRLTLTLYMIDHGHHRSGVSGFLVDVLNLHDLDRSGVRRGVRGD